jgi:hypothetical protein
LLTDEESVEEWLAKYDLALYRGGQRHKKTPATGRGFFRESAATQ